MTPSEELAPGATVGLTGWIFPTWVAADEMIAKEQSTLESNLRRLAAREDRITDAYVAEAIALDGYKSEMER